MCEPATIATVATIASASITAYGQYRQGQHTQAVMNRNADLAKIKAAETRAIGAQEADRHLAKVHQIMGAATAKMGASGAMAGSGSFSQVLDESAKFGALDMQTIQANALKQAWGYDAEADSLRAQGDSAMDAGRMNAFGTLLGAAPGVYKGGVDAGWWKGPKK